MFNPRQSAKVSLSASSAIARACVLFNIKLFFVGLPFEVNRAIAHNAQPVLGLRKYSKSTPAMVTVTPALGRSSPCSHLDGYKSLTVAGVRMGVWGFAFMVGKGIRGGFRPLLANCAVACSVG